MNRQGAAPYEPLTPRLALGLAAPHTWPASVLPVLLGGVLAWVRGGEWDFVLFYCSLAAAVLMQSAVNTLNDYCDFVKETDRLDNSADPEDAVLIYHRLNPRQVCGLGFAFLAAAALPGLWVVYQRGVAPLVIGLLGGAVIVCYSFGKLPISYLPLGELVSGVVMGGLIPLAVYDALTGCLCPQVLWSASPLILGIALIMFSNNLCDIERDLPAGRRTLPCLLGRPRALALYRGLLVLMPVLVSLLALLHCPRSRALLPLFWMAGAPVLIRQLRLPMTPEARERAMPGILALNRRLILGYLALILLHGSAG